MLHSSSTHWETYNALITQKSKSCVFYHLKENFQLYHTWLQIEAPNIIELYNRQFYKEYINYDFSHWLHTTASCWFFWTKIQIWNCKVSFEISLFKVVHVSNEFILCLHWTFVNRVRYSHLFSHIERWDKYTTSCTWVTMKSIKIGQINKQLPSLLWKFN